MKAKWSVFATLPLLAGCGYAFGAGVGVHYEEGYREGPYYEHAHAGGARYDHTYGSRVDYRRLPLPRRYIPGPGRCRVWYPGLAPSYQPRAGSCRALQRRVPRGAWLVVRPHRQPGVVELIAFDAYRSGIRTRYIYDVRTRRRVNRYY